MTKLLNISDLLACLGQIKPDEAAAYRGMIDDMKVRMAKDVKGGSENNPAPNLSLESYLSEFDQDKILEDLADTHQQTKATIFKYAIEDTATRIAHRIAALLDVRAGYASFDGTPFAGTCVPFYPLEDGAPCPSPLDQFDAGEWDESPCDDTDEEMRARAVGGSVDFNELVAA